MSLHLRPPSMMQLPDELAFLRHIPHSVFALQHALLMRCLVGEKSVGRL